MPLDVEHAEVVLDTLSGAASPTRAPGTAAWSAADRELLKERLRPLVLEILDEELEKHRRSQGR